MRTTTKGLLSRALEGRAEVLKLIGKLSGAHRDYQRLLTHVQELDTMIRARLGISRIHLNRGLLKDALRWADKASQAAEQHYNKHEIVNCSILKAHILVRQGDFDSALKTALHADELIKQHLKNTGSAASKKEFGFLRARLESLIAMIYCMQSDYARAIPLLKATTRKFQKHGDIWNVAVVQQNLGNAFNEIGNYQEAFACYDRSLTIKQKIGDKYGVANTFHNISRALNMDGQYQAALERSQKALKISEEINDISGIGLNFLAIGVHQRCMGNYHKALAAYQASLRIYKDYPEPYIEIANMSNIANVLLLMGDYARCKKTLAKAEPAARKLKNPYLLVNVLNVKAQYYLEKRNSKKSQAAVKECMKICQQCGLVNEEIQALSTLVQIRCRHDTMTDRATRSIVRLLKQAGMLHRDAPSIEALIFLYPARIEFDLAIGDLQAGDRHIKEFVDLAQRIGNKSLLPEALLLQAKVMAARGNDCTKILQQAMKLATRAGRKPILRKIREFRSSQ